MRVKLSDGTEYEIKIVRDVAYHGNIIAITTGLPERGLGIPAEVITKAFKAEVMELIRRYKDELRRGASVRLSGANTISNACFAGFAFGKAGAHRLEQEQAGGEIVLVAAHDDPDAPIPITYEPGMVVRARLFGHEAEATVIGIGTGYRGARRVQVKAGNQTAWIDETDVVQFVRFE